MLRALLQRLQRRTTSGRWIPEIDGLRFVALASVVLFHMEGELAHRGYHPVQPRYAGMVHVFGLGDRGVQLFFVISGFILAQPFAAHFLKGERKPPLARYFLRRVTRLEPPYIFNLIVSAALIQWLWHPGLKQVFQHLLAAVVYMDTLLQRAHGGMVINGVAWSLEIEIQFYLLAPLLAWLLFGIRNATLRRSLFVVLLFGAAAVQHSVNIGPNSLLWQIQYFLAGMLLADLDLMILAHTRPTAWWDVVGVLGWPLVFWLPSGAAYWLAPLCIMLYAGALHGRLFRRLFRIPVLAVVGGMCYTVYLWHPIALSATQRILGRYDAYLPTDYGLYFLIQGVCKLVSMALLCLPMYLLIERPCMDPKWPYKLRNLLLRRPSPEAGMVSGLSR